VDEEQAMQDMIAQFFEALLLPALAGAVISALLTLAMPRRVASRSPAVSAPKPRPTACMAPRRGTRPRRTDLASPRKIIAGEWKQPSASS
jgi:hypothetical protein